MNETENGICVNNKRYKAEGTIVVFDFCRTTHHAIRCACVCSLPTRDGTHTHTHVHTHYQPNSLLWSVVGWAASSSFGSAWTTAHTHKHNCKWIAILLCGLQIVALNLTWLSVTIIFSLTFSSALFYSVTFGMLFRSVLSIFHITCLCASSPFWSDLSPLRPILIDIPHTRCVYVAEYRNQQKAQIVGDHNPSTTKIMIW